MEHVRDIDLYVRVGLKEMLLLWLIRLSLTPDSTAQVNYREKPSSFGTNFVFTIYPHTSMDIYIGTKVQDYVKYNITCESHCDPKHAEISGHFKYPEFRRSYLERTDDNRWNSGNYLPVFSMRTSHPSYVMVVMSRSNQSVAATYLQPLQVSAKFYYFLTAYRSGRLIIMSLDYEVTTASVYLKGNVGRREIRIRNAPRKGAVRVYQDPEFYYVRGTPESQYLRLENWTPLQLLRYECFIFHMINTRGDWTGSRVSSDKPIQVMQGAGEQRPLLPSSWNPDIFLDMAPPKETYGKFYIVLFCRNRKEIGEAKVLASERLTEIDIEITLTVSQITLQEAGDWLLFMVWKDIENPPILITSSKAFVMVQTVAYTAMIRNAGPCMVSVTPVDRWSSSYTFNTEIFAADLDYWHYITIMVQGGHNYEEHLLLDEEPIPIENWSFHIPRLQAPIRNISYVCMKIGTTTHEAYIRGFPNVKFFLSLRAFRNGSGYCTNPFNTYPRINQRLSDCLSTFTKPGDLLDNDCDGKIDEEQNNQRDDDGDGNIDEDLNNEIRVDGAWGPWQTIPCPVKCGETAQQEVRFRKCDSPTPSGEGNPCPGEEKIILRKRCYTDLLICTEDCPRGTWGYNCTMNCGHCVDECNKMNGTCEVCVEGYTTVLCNETCPEICKSCAQNGLCTRCEAGTMGLPWCSTVCEKMFYGYDCESHCSVKCVDQDCDRVTGHCLQCLKGFWGELCSKNCEAECLECRQSDGHCTPSNALLYVFLFFVVVTLTAVVAFLLVKKNDGDDEHGEEAEEEPNPKRKRKKKERRQSHSDESSSESDTEH